MGRWLMLKPEGRFLCDAKGARVDLQGCAAAGMVRISRNHMNVDRPMKIPIQRYRSPYDVLILIDLAHPKQIAVGNRRSQTERSQSML